MMQTHRSSTLPMDNAGIFAASGPGLLFRRNDRSFVRSGLADPETGFLTDTENCG